MKRQNKGAIDSEELKRALIKAQNTIRKKFRELHNQRLNFDYQINEAYKPITAPLKKLVDSQAKAEKIKKEAEEAVVKTEVKEEDKERKEEVDTDFSEMSRAAQHYQMHKSRTGPSKGARRKNRQPSPLFDDDDELSSAGEAAGGESREDISGIYPNLPSDDEDLNLSALSDVPSEKPFITPKPRLYMGKNRYAQLVKQVRNKNSPNLDTLYGFHTIDHDLFLGNDSVKVKGQKGGEYAYEVRGKEFPVTEGLTTLLLHNEPGHYIERDLRSYKEMLEITSAHKNNFRDNGQVNRKAGLKKYDNIIKTLFPPKSRGGRGMTTEMNYRYGGCMKKPQMNYKSVSKAGKFNYTYWDDPNELVDRLRILMASQSVGHTGHDNEMISIIEELREAKIIK